MSLFTKNRRKRREEKAERIERLERGFEQIEKSLKRQIAIFEAISKDHPEYESLDEEKKVEIYKEYYNKQETDE